MRAFQSCQWVWHYSWVLRVIRIFSHLCHPVCFAIELCISLSVPTNIHTKSKHIVKERGGSWPPSACQAVAESWRTPPCWRPAPGPGSLTAGSRGGTGDVCSGRWPGGGTCQHPATTKTRWSEPQSKDEVSHNYKMKWATKAKSSDQQIQDEVSHKLNIINKYRKE